MPAFGHFVCMKRFGLDRRRDDGVTASETRLLATRALDSDLPVNLDGCTSVGDVDVGCFAGLFAGGWSPHGSKRRWRESSEREPEPLNFHMCI